jgi:hypothetical protein
VTFEVSARVLQADFAKIQTDPLVVTPCFGQLAYAKENAKTSQPATGAATEQAVAIVILNPSFLTGPYVKQVIYRYLDCGVLKNGFARIRCEGVGTNIC